MKDRRRPKQPPIENIDDERREDVCLRVAAKYLNIHPRTVLARIEDGRLRAWFDGTWHVNVASVRLYDEHRKSPVRLAS